MLQLPHRDLIQSPLTAQELHAAAAFVAAALPATPQLRWPLLAARTGCDVVVKHENHLPTGAFKVRGGVWVMQQLQTHYPQMKGVVAATRGNHGQSVAFAAERAGLRAVIVVPHGNNPDKNRAMRALGAELVEAGEDFDTALEEARRLAHADSLLFLPSFHPLLVQGVASYALELFGACPELDAVYAPIGLGSGLCGLIAARDALGLDTEIIGVVAAEADAYARSFETGQVVATRSADTLADGLAVRIPDATALAFMRQGVSRIVRCSEASILAAIKAYFEDTHNLAEGAGAAALAALCQEHRDMKGKRVAVILSGGNIDPPTLLRALGQA
jgi:threonine dehydratase